ncbi:MAG: Xaa-Pro peptidase family protein [Chloroflexi bacterium]|nr:Xaa-Pro peptidase family protein [Chloroflexota bacterium]
MKSIIQEKLSQAVGLLNEQPERVDCWIVFVRETSQAHDPALDLILGFGLTWDSALIVTRSGGKIALVGRYDGDSVRELGAYDEVIAYDQGIAESLRARISQINPSSIALDYSLSDPGSDGLTFGMYARLTQILAGTPYAASFVSGEGIVRRLRERKTASELARIRTIVDRTQQVYVELLAAPLRGMTEIQIHALCGDIVARHGCDFGWERVNDPIVNAGPHSSVGHGIPGDLAVEAGQLVHFDMGLRLDGYCSDLQRMVYVSREGESDVPAEIMRAWQACWSALEAGRAALKPGAVCWQVDAAARAELVRQGYPEYMHAFGHHVGRNVHDGGSVLGPRWERYGDLPNKEVEAGNVFAIELGTMVEGYGYLGIEEMVAVTPDGAEYLGQPQRDLPLI